MERAAFMSDWGAKKLKGVCMCTSALYGNAAVSASAGERAALVGGEHARVADAGELELESVAAEVLIEEGERDPLADQTLRSLFVIESDLLS